MSNVVSAVIVDRRIELDESNMFKSYNSNSLPTVPDDVCGDLTLKTAEDYVAERLTSLDICGDS